MILTKFMSDFQEKYQSIPDDLGRDINSTQSYLKKHEGFENELIALEAQVSMIYIYHHENIPIQC